MNVVDAHRKKAQEGYWYPNQCFCHVEFDLDNVKARHLSANPQCTHCKKWIVILTKLSYLSCMTPLIIPYLPV